MIQIEFNYKQQFTKIQAQLNDKFQNVINSFIQKSLLNPDSIYYLANGNVIDLEQTVENQMNEMDKQNQKLKVLVYLIEEDNTNIQVLVNSKDIICSLCHEPCRVKTKNYKLSLSGCVNKHKINNINIKDFPNTQKINISNIICEKCRNNNKGNSANHEFYKCLTCKQNLCILCRSNHVLNHKIINYDQKNYICQKHNEAFIKYCKGCKKNICFSCDEEHEGHNTIFLGDIRPNIEEIKNNLLQIKAEVESFNNEIKNMIKKLNELKDSINIYFEIYNNLINSYERQNRNYQILQILKKFDINNEIFKSIREINGITNIKDKLFNIIDLYNNINSDTISNKPLEKASFLRNDGDLNIYLFPSIKFILNSSNNSQNEQSQCMQISKQINRKIILLLGEKNSGKTTFLNSFINALCKLQLQDNHRYVLTEEFNRNIQTKIDTKYITIYNIDSINNNPPITIIDTPGFETGIEFEEKINEIIKNLFNNYIDHINVVCFIANSNNNNFTSDQKNIINNILSFFGNDIVENFIPIFTFSNGQKPLIINSLLENESIFRKFIYEHIKNYNPWYLQFNNTIFFENKRKNIITQKFWEFGLDNFKKFFDRLNNLSNKSLNLSIKILETREKMQNKIVEFTPLIEQCGSFIMVMKNEINRKKIAADLINKTKNYKYKVKAPKFIKEDLKPGLYTTNCLFCARSCYYNCPYSDNEKKKCAAMDSNGYCTVCPQKCHWTLHENVPYVFKEIEIEIEKTDEEFKSKYFDSQKQLSLSEQIIKGKELNLEKKMIECCAIHEEIKDCVDKLEKEALYPNVNSSDEYIDALIVKEKNEKKTGYEERIKILETIKQNNRLINQMFKQGTDCQNFEEFKRKVMEGNISFVEGKNCRVKLTNEDKNRLCIIF